MSGPFSRQSLVGQPVWTDDIGSLSTSFSPINSLNPGSLGFGDGGFGDGGYGGGQSSVNPQPQWNVYVDK